MYKQGQAGVTKATVSVTWHNNDPSCSPAGYEDKEYITVTRQARSLLPSTGGHSAGRSRAWRFEFVPQQRACRACWTLQVVVGGRNKYMINGHTVQEK